MVFMRALCAVSQEELEAGSSSTSAPSTARGTPPSSTGGGTAAASGKGGLVSPSAGEQPFFKDCGCSLAVQAGKTGPGLVDSPYTPLLLRCYLFDSENDQGRAL